MNFKITRPIVLSIILTLLCGCAALESLNQKRFTVDLSPLDWVQFSHTVYEKGNAAPVTVRLELAASGYLKYTSGRSSRVKTDFWQDTNSSNWQNMRTDYVVLSKEYTEQTYQRIVDAGVFDRVKPTKEESENANLVILAKIGFEKKLTLTSDPILINIFNELLSKF